MGQLIKILVLGAMLYLENPLDAEIENITLKWTPQLCNDICIKGLDQYLRQVNGVAEISINQAAGQANLRWKPYVSFSYYPVNQAMQMIGLYLKDIRVRVRGTITHTSTNITLTSLGDNTPFTLLGTIHPSSIDAPAVNNPQSYQLNPQMRQKLLDTESQNQVVTIEGPLFEAYRSPPLLLVIEQLHIAKPPQAEKP